MENIKEKQQKIGMSKFMMYFLQRLVKFIDEDDNIGVLIFLAKVEKVFSEKTMKCVIPLKKRRDEAWNSLQDMKTNEERDATYASLQEEIRKIDQEMNSSFGLINIFREIGQLFQSSRTGLKRNAFFTKSSIDRQVEHFPKIIAKLTILGFPLEILDGHGKNMARDWLKNVFEQLDLDLRHADGSKKKVLRVSVVGKQSSGKSTFLNAMYGTNFAVSAGRCTTGVFMQLIPVNQSGGPYPYEYIAVIDTEGLKSNEFSDLERDNELALLTVGLGNISIVNLMGESITDMKDLLQIVVHAALRMRVASTTRTVFQTGDGNTSQKCIFVHQNIVAQNANEKVKLGLQNTVQELDMMTNEAADMEDINSINTFNQVLKFDINSDIFYIPGLWTQNYCNEAKNVKNSITQEFMAKHQNHLLTIDKIFENIDILWESILAENFVFSFKNSMQVKAFGSLENEVYKLTRDVECTLNASRANKEIEIDRMDKKDIEEAFEALVLGFKDNVIAEYSNKSKLLQNFFEEQSNKAYLEEFKEKTFQGFEKKIHQIEDDQIEKLSAHKRNKDKTSKSAEFIDEFIGKITEQIKKEAKKYDESSKKEVEELKNAFHYLWKNETRNLKLQDETQNEAERSQLARQCLYNLFRSNHHMCINEELQLSDVEDRIITFEQLRHNLQANSFHKNIHYDHSSWLYYNAKTEIYNRVKDCFDRSDDYLKQYKGKANKFDKECLMELGRLLVKELTSKDTDLKILPGLVIKITILMFRYALHIFDDMNKKYEDLHSHIKKLEEAKEVQWNMFHGKVMETAHDMNLARTLSRQLKTKLIEKTEEELVEDIYYDALHMFPRKSDLLIQLQQDLLSKDYDALRYYLDFSKKYAYKFVKNKVESRLFNQQNDLLERPTKYSENARVKIHKHIGNVKQSIEDATKKIHDEPLQKLKKWVMAFRQSTTIAASEDIYQTLLSHDDIEDVEDFKKYILENIDNWIIELTEYFQGKTTDTVNFHDSDPYQSALDECWGCDEKCWFCGETCKYHLDHANNHACVQHRPKGMTGTHWKGTNKLAVDNCTYAVQSEVSFSCMTTKTRNSSACTNCNCTHENHEWHPYKEYVHYVDKWNIPPTDVFDSSQYWMFMFCKYEDDLCKTYNNKSVAIPKGWRKITKEDAYKNLIDSLVIQNFVKPATLPQT